MAHHSSALIKESERDPNLLEFGKIVGSEESSIEWCKANGLLPIASSEATCWKELDGVKCTGSVYTTTKAKDGKAYPIFRCRKCKSTKTLRAGAGVVNPGHTSGPGQLDGRGTWFSSIDALGRNSSRLPISVILMLLWGWARQFSFKQMREVFGGLIGTANNHLLTDWFYYIRELVADYLDSSATPMGGPGEEVQIDESFFGGKRKYKRGRLLAKDKFEKRRRPLSKSRAKTGKKKASPTKRKNFGNRVVNRFGWVFGLVWARPDGVRERRFFRVEKRDRATLRPIIEQHVAGGTTIVSDCWKAYHGLGDWCPSNGGPPYLHKTVNHSENFVDPASGAHTQRIESCWRILKIQLRSVVSGKRSSEIARAYLAEAYFRSICGNLPFLEIVKMIKEYYPQ